MTETKTVLITGASSGIGLATAQRLLEQGYRVIGISRRGQVDELDHPGFTALALDLDNLEQVERHTRQLLKTNVVDCFVHAAGQGLFGSIEQFSVVQIERLLRINLASAMVICRNLVPAFRRRGKGRIVFIGSESALAAGRKGALYCASKFGLRGFCLSLREDCAGAGVQVSLVNPGMVRSPFFDDLDFAPGALPENAIAVADVADIVAQILQSSDDIVIDEVNLSPRVKSINLGNKP
ncbi:MAG: SDR family NAD(P)-dependent oxidoreductase [Gammaproteobacteria bacterium]|nr:SDR family NAD(P)-dependent oxidoreductase [Gammaproteobacteria bacterium]